MAIEAIQFQNSLRQIISVFRIRTKQFYEDFQKDTVILGVNLTSTEEKIEDIRPFIEEFGLTFTIVLDEEGDTMMDYGVIAYPTTYFINEQGVIREIFRGAINYEIMQNTIGAL
ncbi:MULTISPECIES: TlpA disulfide reductase family protein [Paenibacillus]|uniref:TlpA family protein disulfide reductase n=1 Tax=Paenibacillus tianjinensis TaxID=2810347 RepID=A0ABX7L3X9_9BACL|nr:MULTISPECIES: TlpA disulfide reductase family protein [Paenibacillus]QSF42470.1 TlpA family protein disulfide reductase [Paenibacillus tianjinensis]